MTSSKCEESDGVRKVRLKTTSGVLTLCYRSSQPSLDGNNSPDTASMEKVSQGSVSEELSFGSLPELFEFSDRFSIREDVFNISSPDLRPNFSTYNFPHALDLSDTFLSCDLGEMVDIVAPGLEQILDDAHFSDGFQSRLSKSDAGSFQNKVKSSTMIGEVNTKSKSFWDFPLELEEDIFECTNHRNSVQKAIDEKDSDGENVVNDFLIDLTPESSECLSNAGNSDSNLLVYAPNRYLEETCIFQSSPGRCLKNFKHDPTGESNRLKGRAFRISDFVNHRRKRFSARRADKSKLAKGITLTSSDKRSLNEANLDIKLGGRAAVRSPVEKTETARSLFRVARTNVEYREEISEEKSASNAVKDILSQSSSRGPSTETLSPLKEILSISCNREPPTLNLSPNPCLLKKRRSAYADVYHSSEDSKKIGPRFTTESLSHSSPKCSKASTPLDSPANCQFQNPKISHKKLRTSRRRPLQGSPEPCRPKSHFYGKIIYDGSSRVLQSKPSPEREVKKEKKSTERRGRGRLPLPPRSVEILQGWLYDNLADPYPSRQEKAELLFRTHLKMSQVENWLGNARQKLKLKSRAVRDLCNRSSL